MKRGRKPLILEYDSTADYLRHVISRPQWRVHHFYECIAIDALIRENEALKAQQRRHWWQWWKH